MRLSKTKRQQAIIAKYREWKEAGNAPATREAAFEIIDPELTAAMSTIELSALKSGSQGASALRDQVRNYVAEGGDEDLSFIAWDLSQNNGAAIRYRRDYDDISHRERLKASVAAITCLVPRSTQPAASIANGQQRVDDVVISKSLYRRVKQKLLRVDRTFNCLMEELLEGWVKKRGMGTQKKSAE